MARGKKSFIFYANWVNTFKELPKDKGYDLLMHILAYVNDENPKTDDILIKAVFANIKDQLKSDLDRWEQQQEQRKEAGKKSAEIRKRNATKNNDRSTTVDDRSSSSTDSASVNASVSDSDSDKHQMCLWLEKTYPKIQNMKSPITNDEAERLKSDYNSQFIVELFGEMQNKKDLLKKYDSANLTFRSWARMNGRYKKWKEQNGIMEVKMNTQ